MIHPYQIGAVDDTLRRKIAAHLVTNHRGEHIPTVSQMLKHIPREMPEWSKAKLLDRKEIIRIAVLINNDETKFHDNTFVKVSKIDPFYIS
jgi:hypothetical protein